MSKDYKRLFSQGRIGTFKLKNRIVMPPMGSEGLGEFSTFAGSA